MEQSNKKNNTPYIVAIIILSIISVLLATMLLSENRRATMHRQALTTGYMQSIRELSSYITNMSQTLDKGLYVGTGDQLRKLSANLWRDAASAKNSLVSIPTGELDTAATYRFLSQVGNYAMYLSDKYETTADITAEEYTALTQLANYSKALGKQIYAMEENLASGDIDLYNYMSVDSDKSTNQSDILTLSSQVKELEQGFEGYPTLIYDGPFSDHLLEIEPQLTMDKPLITQEQALTIAAKTAGVNTSELKFTGEEHSRMPSYCFEGNSISVSVTKNGGYSVYMLNSRNISDKKISSDDAIKKAEEYLKSQNILNMEYSYYEVKNNICTVNFAYVQDGVVCYTDLIKVGVAMDNGEIISMDARGYIVNHKARIIDTPQISEGDGAKIVSPRLKIESSRLALIPTTGKKEILCHEYKTISENGDNVLVYINALTGKEEQILILLIDKNGVLTV